MGPADQPAGVDREPHARALEELERLRLAWDDGLYTILELADQVAELIAASPDLSLAPLPPPLQRALWQELVASYRDFDPAGEYLSLWGGTAYDPVALQAWRDAELERWRTTVAPRVQAWLRQTQPPAG